MHGATRQNRFLSARSIWWLYIVLLIVGIAYGSAFVVAAFNSWSDYLHPPTFVGFGPFRLGTPFHLAMFGTDIRVGDVIRIDVQYRGRVVASMDTGEYLQGEDSWAYLGEGIMVDTDFAGLVHYRDETAEDFVLIARGADA